MAYCVDCDNEFDKPADKPYVVRCFSCWLKWKEYCDAYDPRNKSMPVKVVESAISENVRHLLQLCHPDKHNNSKLSRTVTQWLLELRSRL